jgi:type I restriction enzyme S subunit
MQLGEITEPKIDQAGPQPCGGFTYVDISSVDNNAKRIVDPKRLPADSAPSRARQRLRSGDVLVSMTRPNLNAVALVPPELDGAIGSTGFHVLRARDGVLPQWLYYGVQTRQFVGAMSELVQGALYPAVRPKDIRAFDMPLPALDEQRRIVAELEKQFSRLDEAVANLRRAIVAMSAYRASVLEAAIRGQLVSESGPTSASRLDDLIGQIHQGWSPKCDLQRVPEPDEWAVITTTAVQPMKYVDNQGKPLPAALEPRPRLEIQPGDFLVTRKGPRARAGVACLVRQTRRRLMVCDTVYRFRCDESTVVPDYLEIALNAPSVVQAVDRQKAGINESGVSLTHQKLGGIAIPVPSREAQHRIVAEVDRRLSIVREVETEVDANLKRAQALRSAVLASAFRVQ